MAFFKFRKQGDDQSSAPTPSESVETMRKRAKYRLIGAAVLVIAGVIGFPLMFDQQPRPIAVDMPIDIPDRNKVAPLAIPDPVIPAVPTEAKPGKPDATTVKEAVASVSVPTVTPEKPKSPADLPAEKTVETQPKTVAKLADKPAVSVPPASKPSADADQGAKARDLLEGGNQAKEAPALVGRYVVQVGAFADAARAREVRLKMEKAGLKTYTHVAETKDGPRVRVRVGPFDSKAEADSAAQKIKKLDLPATILTL